MNKELLVSFDVILLCSRIPVDLALQVCHVPDTLGDEMSLSVANVMSILSLCLIGTCFFLLGCIYKHVFATAIVSPVSVVVAHLVMKYIEKKVFTHHAIHT